MVQIHPYEIPKTPLPIMKITTTALLLATAFSCAAPPNSQPLNLTDGTRSAFPVNGSPLAEGRNLHYCGDASVGLKEDLKHRLIAFHDSIEASSMEGFGPSISSGKGDYLGYSYVKVIGQAGVSFWILVLGDNEMSLNYLQEEQSEEWLITKFETTEIGADARVYHFQGSKTWEEGVLHLILETVGGRKMRLDI